MRPLGSEKWNLTATVAVHADGWQHPLLSASHAVATATAVAAHRWPPSPGRHLPAASFPVKRKNDKGSGGGGPRKKVMHLQRVQVL